MTIEPADDVLLCYCTMLTVGALRRACAERRWPLPGKERTGRLCTGCAGDLVYCLRRFTGSAGPLGGDLSLPHEPDTR